MFLPLNAQPHTHKCEAHSLLDPLIRALLSLRPLRMTSLIREQIRLIHPSVRERLPAGTRVNCPIAVRTHSQNVPALWIIDGRQSVCLTTFKCFHGGSKSNQNTHEHEHDHSWSFRIFISCLLSWRHTTRCYWCSLVGHKFKLAFDMYLIMPSQSNHIIIHACSHRDSLHTVNNFL